MGRRSIELSSVPHERRHSYWRHLTSALTGRAAGPKRSVATPQSGPVQRAVRRHWLHSYFPRPHVCRAALSAYLRRPRGETVERTVRAIHLTKRMAAVVRISN